MAASTAPRRRGTLHSQGPVGWLFVSPVLVILGLFLLVPILMALWVSVSDWNGNGSPFASGVHYVGMKNYTSVVNGVGLSAQQFGYAVRNNLYYVLFVVPLQTCLALFLAVMVTRKHLKGKNVFRTAFYFPSVTSSVAITVLWMFLFSGSGAVNKAMSWIGIHGPDWFQEPTGVFTRMFGLKDTGWMAQGHFLGIDHFQWLAGPSFAMLAFIIMAIFSTSGTFMLLFIAALQNISDDTDEAAMIDGANAWARFRHITLPLLRPTLFTVITLGLIGTWQVFDQVAIATQGGPAYTTLTPAYLAYSQAFGSGKWGRASAIAFILFAIIIIMTLIQRLVLGDSDATRMSRRQRRLDNAQRARAAQREQLVLDAALVQTQDRTSGGIL